ncbi:energy transducer TonB [Novosphingobium aquimarinum]|uniref:energy transducer TonB n=1 Tax=Novosphingobium aquimarinum TaxID=2682494 RepID=UPI0012EB7B2D|nr:energy transducer TonB [Novosphingobium aquimarinum]
MNAAHPHDQAERRRWLLALGTAGVAHLAAVAFLMPFGRAPEPPVPEPVVLLELPPEAAAAPSVQQQATQPQPETPLPQVVTPRLDVPDVRAPLPRDAVALPPPPPPLPARAPRAAPVVATNPAPTPIAVAPAGAGTGTSQTAGNDPKAKAQEADYFALVSAHLNRKKRYPTEAKKARQQGVVTIRFTVARDGTVSGISVKRSSGHELLDAATMDLLQRVSPLPKFPSSMKRDSVTLSLPIDYSLKTS